MTEQEVKAIKWMKNIRDDAVIILDYIAKEEPNVSPLFYSGRKEKAETVLNALEEIQQYRALGTVEELREAREKQIPKKWIDHTYDDLIVCPNCNAEFNILDNCTEEFNYCPKCGKRLE